MLKARFLSIAALMFAVGVSRADDALDSPAGPDPSNATEEFILADHPLLPQEGLVALNPQNTVFIDAEHKRLYLRTRVALREGLLEMFVCKAMTKEHESVLAVDSEAFVIHGGLLAIGAETGTPVRYMPEFQPPTGQQIDIFVLWTDTEGQEHRSRAQEWVRHVTRRYFEEPLDNWPEGIELPEDLDIRYDERNKLVLWFGPLTEAQRDRILAMNDDPQWTDAFEKIFNDSQSREMEADFVFAGSGFYTDEEGKRWYLAESGNVICVANFGDAMIDVAAESTAEGAGLLFEPYTERIPELGTEVIVEMIPVESDPAAE
jgi:hypothetical protein